MQKLYATEFGAPNSPAAQALLHASYSARNSARGLLMRFLDAVDRRDAQGAARLFHPDGLWPTASRLGDVQGRSNIEALIQSRLPARRYGPAYARHRMASAADVDDLTVVTPSGERCRFSLETSSMQQDGHDKTVIRTLKRLLLSGPNGGRQ